MALGANVRYYREAAGYTLDRLSEISGVDLGTIFALEKRDSGRSKYASALAKALNVPLEVLLSDPAGETQEAQLKWLASHIPSRGAPAEPSNVSPAPDLIASRWVAVVGHVKAGPDGYLDELQYPVGEGDGYVEYWVKDPSAYAVRVKGDSMHPRYRAGEFIVVTPGIEATPGRDVVVKLKDGRKLLKQLNWIRDGDIQLLSINNGYAPMTIALEDVDSVHRVAGHVSSDAFHHERTA